MTQTNTAAQTKPLAKTLNRTVTRTKPRNSRYDVYRLGADPQCYVSTNSFETRLNNNIMVIGGSGSGKTMGISLPMLLHSRHTNPVAIFTKRTLMMKVARYLRKARHMNVTILDISQPENSDAGYDPLKQCRNAADIRDLCRAIVYKDPSIGSTAKDPYWDESACGLLECLTEFMLRDTDGEGGMADVLKLLDDFRYVPLDNQQGDSYNHTVQGMISRRLPKLTNNTSVLGTWNTFINLASNTARCIVSSLRTPVDSVFTTVIRRFLQKEKQFDAEWLLQKNTALFICMSPVSTAHKRFATLLYSQLFKNLYELAERQEDGRLPHPVNIICDDFGTSPIQDFPEMISIMREKNISTTILLQSLSQLEHTYGSSGAVAICDNCDRTVYLGSNNLSSADEISRRADAPLQDVLNMPLGKEYFFERGRYPVLSKSYDVFADATYHEMLKVAAKAEREEAKQKRIETEELMKELAEMEAAIENKEEAFHDFIADLSNLDEE